MLDDESCYSSRPASARTLGSTSGWPSDTDSPRPLRGLPFADSRISSISHFESPAKIQSLMISESSKVEDFLARALRTMQQLAVKRIAKAWIKGICPRKQAVFPYHKKSKESGERVHVSAHNPGWWPSEKLCKFVEPDHIKRDGKSTCHPLIGSSTDRDRTNQSMPPPPAPEANTCTTEGVEQGLRRTSSDSCKQRLDGFPQGTCSALNYRRSEGAR